MTEQAPVGIVGAGPVGLSLAVRLACHGIPSVILEAGPELKREGSKACLIQGDVVEVLDKAGRGQEIADEGVMWHVARTYIRGRQVEMRDYPIPIGFGPFINISQYRIEQVLLEEVNRRPECTIVWDRPVTEVAQDEDGVTVTAGGEQYQFGYLAACDGVRSTLRSLLDVAWHGRSYPDTFLITDIQAKLPLAAERHFHYDPPFNPGRQLVMHSQPDNVWRIDWQLPPDADIEAEKRTGDLDKRIRKVIGDVPYEVKWLSTYHFQERIVERFRVGRIFFAGDSAHALPPYGSRGMNSGIQDADNLAWKLAWVLSGRSGPELLDSYHTERYQATQENLRVTGATIRFMQPASAARRWARFILLRAALAAGPFARLVNSGKMAEPFRYVESPVIDQAGDDQLIGAFAPDLTVRAGTGPASTASASTGSANTGSASTGSASTAQADGAPVRLRRYFGAGFVAVHVTDDAVGAASLDQRLSSGSKDLEHVIVLAGGATSANGTGAASGASRVVSCADGGSAAPYRAGYWYLVRPDGHIAASGPAAGLDALADVHARCSGAAEPVGAALA